MVSENSTNPEAKISPKTKMATVTTSPVTAKIAMLLAEGAIETRDDLNFVVEHHSALLSGDRLIPIVQKIPTAFAELPQTHFLQAVVFYHLQHKETADKQDWAKAYEKFATLLPHANTGEMLGFYIPNYCFLALRNKGGDAHELEDLFVRTRAGAEQIPEPAQHQLMGFITYNYARLLIKQGRQADAAPFYIAAGNARVSYYLKIKDTANQTDLRGAATQVWKIREDWETLLPNADISDCPVTKELFDEVAVWADPAFSAKSKKS